MNEYEIVGSDGTEFDLRWDGWSGQLRLYPTAWQDAPNVLITARREYSVRYEILHDAQDSVEKLTGPGYLGTATSWQHRIVFWVALEEGEQRFDGYLFNQTGADAMAGVVWWQDEPYGFYGVRRLRIPG
jgi:hypothetical protein